jgi:hypothetical protein
MKGLRTVALLSLLSTLVAGCTGGGGGGKAQEDPTADLGLEATDTTGVIRGVVVNEAIVPIAGATITLTIGSEKRNATSTDAGAFGFDGLAPGTYFLTASKPGFASVQQSADVVAGETEPPLVRVQLVYDPGLRPYWVPYQFEGFIACSVRVFVRGQSCDVQPESNEEILFDIELDAVPTFAQAEMVWDSTQSLGDDLSLNWRRDDTNDDYVDIEGPSPLILNANQTTFADEEVGAGQPLRTIVFTAHNPATEPPAGGLWGVGVQANQKFMLYIHVFYNMVPPEGWTFGADGDPPQPE